MLDRNRGLFLRGMATGGRMILSTADALTSYYSGGHGQRIEADAINGDRESCLEAGMDGQISKPVKRETMFAELNCVLGESRDGRTVHSAERDPDMQSSDTTTLRRALWLSSLLLGGRHPLSGAAPYRRLVSWAGFDVMPDSECRCTAAHPNGG